MKNVFKNLDWKKVGTFAGGFVFGTAGVKVLASDDAKKVYTQCTAAVLRAKECVMKTVNLVQENCEDILEGAKDINEEPCTEKRGTGIRRRRFQRSRRNCRRDSKRDSRIRGVHQ